MGREIPVFDLLRLPTMATLARHLSGEAAGTLRKVHDLAGQQRMTQQRQKVATERLPRAGRSSRG